eukprot:TRINITY_DN9044_c2_g1_i1.p1 TRINITY_DN9044_c2_g1~~TRINITY_DN9044_c2_g1_i1.p1  ORF type:complete len:233 (+),score=29.80 TRINITY_DN9044_c2_g1_i1:126-824(+)
MAVNPLLANDSSSDSLFPMPEGGEQFVLKRNNVDFECELPTGSKLWGRGNAFLSSKRLVFLTVERSCRQDFKSFAIPLQTMRKPKFEQPIFGANYLWGFTEPLPGTEHETTSLPCVGGKTKFTLTFLSGGCNTLLPLLLQLLKEIQADLPQGNIAQAAQNGTLGQVAYVDPTDPSVLYLSQPTAVPGSQQMTAFDVEEPSAPAAPVTQAEQNLQDRARGGQRQEGNQNCIIS